MKPQYYRKRPTVIEALHLDGHQAMHAAIAWCDKAIWGRDGELIVTTDEGAMRATLGDWLIKGVEGEFYPCKDSVFQKTYDALATKPVPICSCTHSMRYHSFLEPHECHGDYGECNCEGYSPKGDASNGG